MPNTSTQPYGTQALISKPENATTATPITILDTELPATPSNDPEPTAPVVLPKGFCANGGRPGETPVGFHVSRGTIVFFDTSSRSFVAEPGLPGFELISEQLRLSRDIIGVSPDYRSIAFWPKTENKQSFTADAVMDGVNHLEVQLSAEDLAASEAKLAEGGFAVADVWWATNSLWGVRYVSVDSKVNNDVVVFVDPSTGATRSDLQRVVGSVIGGNVYLSPDERSVATLTENDQGQQVWNIKSVQTGEVLMEAVQPWRIPNESTRGAGVWSPSSTYFAFVGLPGPQVAAENDGSGVISLFNATDRKTEPLVESIAGPFGKLTWSPVDNTIGFVEGFVMPGSTSGSEQVLKLADSRDGHIRLTCPLIGSFVSSPGGYPVWSPDGTYIGYSPVVQPDSGSPVSANVIDLASGEVFTPFAKGSLFAGWLVSAP